MRPSHDKKPKDKEEKVALLPDRPNLTKGQVEFLHVYTASAFLPINEICRQAGVTPSQVAKWKKGSERFRSALDIEHRRSQTVVNMDRKNVMKGMLEAVDMAKDMRQPSSMISGWREIGRMCGFYEPERREIKLSVNSAQLVEELKNLPRERLLEIASQPDPLEAEFEVVES